MGQEERIQNAYRGLGGKRTFYDGMITCSTLSGRAVCRLVWGMGRAETQDYLCVALSGIPEGFSGRLLEVPVGTGILTMPLYREMPEAEITCLDYSPEMLERAKSHIVARTGEDAGLLIDAFVALVESQQELLKIEQEITLGYHDIVKKTHEMLETIYENSGMTPEILEAIERGEPPEVIMEMIQAVQEGDLNG